MSRSINRTGARTPEELETLFEDALVMDDRELLAEMYEDHAVLVTAAAGSALGARKCFQLALALWQGDQVYVADPQSVTQTQDLALIISNDCISVMRRDREGSWKYAIVLQGHESGKE